MKIVTIPTIILALAAAAPVRAQSTPSRTITVNGQAEIKVQPVEVVVTLGIETDSMDIARARAENDARVKAVVASAVATGLRTEDIRTEFLDVQPRYSTEYDRRTFLGYFARRSLSLTLKDTSRFEALITAVLGAGANYIHGVDFRTTELRKHRDEARAMAIRAAREKARDMAAALSVTIGTPTNIQEGYSGWWSPYSVWWGGRFGGAMVQNVMQDRGGGAAGSDSLVPGQISVTANVSVTFEISGGA